MVELRWMRRKRGWFTGDEAILQMRQWSEGKGWSFWRDVPIAEVPK